jgi:hypothetical protein
MFPLVDVLAPLYLLLTRSTYSIRSNESAVPLFKIPMYEGDSVDFLEIPYPKVFQDFLGGGDCHFPVE